MKHVMERRFRGAVKALVVEGMELSGAVGGRDSEQVGVSCDLLNFVAVASLVGDNGAAFRRP